ncbi:MAG: class I SAM-dependent rRNA methyltransferase [Elusimicrobiaceae bacterium]|nr:class I SAM-dependent rRNA methyltransferase [Elusimicrobiaceae bacterium]
MEKTANLPELKLKAREERRIAHGHCWVFSNELEPFDRKAEPGGLCRVMSAEGRDMGTGYFNPHSLIAVRLLTAPGVELEDNFIQARLRAAYDYRSDMGYRKFCRVCYGEADCLPGLIVDRYGDYLAVNIQSAGMELHKPEITAALKKIFKPAGLHFNNESPFRELEGLSTLPAAPEGEFPETAVVEQGDVAYEVPLMSGQKSGFYYDQRDNRDALAPYFEGRVVLDLYSYAGGFGIKAAKCGAEKVFGIDSSAQAVEFASKNAERNGVADRAVFHREDAERALSALKKGELPEMPDFVVLDPPNLVKGRKNFPQARQHYIMLNAAAFTGLPEDGLLATFTCSHHVSREAFMDIINVAAARSGRRATLLWTGMQAKDHPVRVGVPETAYLNGALLRVH